MSSIRVVTIVVVIVAALAVFAIFVGNPFVPPPSSTANQQNQILFVGAGFNQTEAVRNSTIVGNFQINMTQPSLLKLTLGDQKYYSPGSIGNGSTFSNVDTFQNGSVSVDSATYNFGTFRDCTATAASTNTIGNTVIEYATCNASTVTPVIGSNGIRVTSGGVWQFAYSLQVPSNASLGTYLIDFDMQSQSLENFANLSNNLVYVLTVTVSE